MLAEIASLELTDIVSSSPENRSEIDPSQNEKKKVLIQIWKKQVAFF